LVPKRGLEPPRA